MYALLVGGVGAGGVGAGGGGAGLLGCTELVGSGAEGTASCKEGTGEVGAVVGVAGVSPIGRMPPKRRVALAHR